jgi:hypothetical protein
LTFALITLALRITPVFSNEIRVKFQDAIINTGFEINSFKLPPKLKLLAKSRMSHSIFNKKDVYKICIIKNKNLLTCGRNFEFDKEGQLYQTDNINIMEDQNLGKKHNVGLNRNGLDSTAQIRGILAKNLYNYLSNVYIEKDETDLYKKELKDAVDISCLKISIDENEKYSCQFKLLTQSLP